MLMAAGEERGIPQDRLLADLRSEGASTDELALMQQAAREIRRIESGAQAGIEGAYPAELSGLTDNLNTLIQQERVSLPPALILSTQLLMGVLFGLLGLALAAARWRPTRVAAHLKRHDR